LPFPRFLLRAHYVDLDEQSLEPWDPEQHYRKKMHTLLWMEESNQKKLIRRFDKNAVDISSQSPYSKIIIPHLNEKMPPVVSGDIIYAWLPGKVIFCLFFSLALLIFF
jgi:hypothetical protein